VLDFDSFPTDARSRGAHPVPAEEDRAVDVESAGAMSYWVQTAADKKGDVVVVMAPLDIVARYEAPFPLGGDESGPGDNIFHRGAGIGAGERAERDGEAQRARPHGAGGGTRACSSGALPGTASTELEDVAAGWCLPFVYG